MDQPLPLASASCRGRTGPAVRVATPVRGQKIENRGRSNARQTLRYEFRQQALCRAFDEAVGAFGVKARPRAEKPHGPVKTPDKPPDQLVTVAVVPTGRRGEDRGAQRPLTDIGQCALRQLESG